MSEGLISKEIKESLEKIISHCFYSNRMLDRICSVLSVNFVMPITAEIIHHNLAHLYPLLADEITEYMDGRDCTTIYGATPIGNQDYETVLDCFNKMLEINLELESIVKETIILSQSANDYTTKVFLENYLLKLIPITKDILLLVDKTEMYGESDTNMMRLDHDITSFNIFGD